MGTFQGGLPKDSRRPPRSSLVQALPVLVAIVCVPCETAKGAENRGDADRAQAKAGPSAQKIWPFDSGATVTNKPPVSASQRKVAVSAVAGPYAGDNTVGGVQDGEDPLGLEMEFETTTLEPPPEFSLGYTPNLSPGLAWCRDTDDGFIDSLGDTCLWYTMQGGGTCGLFDTEWFVAEKLCCICGGGSTRPQYDVEDVPICNNDCTEAAHNEVCEDGGARSVSEICEWGTDCGDCGPRFRATKYEEEEEFKFHMPWLNVLRQNPRYDEGIQRATCCKLAKTLKLTIVMARNPKNIMTKEAEEEQALAAGENENAIPDANPTDEAQTKAAQMYPSNGFVNTPHQEDIALQQTPPSAPEEEGLSLMESGAKQRGASQLQLATELRRARETWTAARSTEHSVPRPKAQKTQRTTLQAPKVSASQQDVAANIALARSSRPRRGMKVRSSLMLQVDLNESKARRWHEDGNEEPAYDEKAELINGYEAYIIQVKKESNCDKLGFNVNRLDGEVTDIRKAHTFLVGKWNYFHPNDAVKEGDYISQVCMNGYCDVRPDLEGMIAKLTFPGKCGVNRRNPRGFLKGMTKHMARSNGLDSQAVIQDRINDLAADKGLNIGSPEAELMADEEGEQEEEAAHPDEGAVPVEGEAHVEPVEPPKVPELVQPNGQPYGTGESKSEQEAGPQGQGGVPPGAPADAQAGDAAADAEPASLLDQEHGVIVKQPGRVSHATKRAVTPVSSHSSLAPKVALIHQRARSARGVAASMAQSRAKASAESSHSAANATTSSRAPSLASQPMPVRATTQFAASKVGTVADVANASTLEAHSSLSSASRTSMSHAGVNITAARRVDTRNDTDHKLSLHRRNRSKVNLSI
eukprot:TRINITY_DN31531_c0_g1_i1.p1 TRINITY_DN31531_c0_g1~~TRINITY_DN31531_c0_g1_i1.p1  ORF type:complete len:865 (+),score=176.54 TRINITY_DN31531_c0_g1_i1:73-2667(+)